MELSFGTLDDGTQLLLVLIAQLEQQGTLNGPEFCQALRTAGAQHQNRFADFAELLEQARQSR
ncbi:MAG: hypothetical protein II007_04585 [Gammaproteobacteria bacterium]|nr:hypothetical protein [Gammaproteobacteria bacterium]